jgi:hypothetical protein
LLSINSEKGLLGSSTSLLKIEEAITREANQLSRAPVFYGVWRRQQPVRAVILGLVDKRKPVFGPARPQLCAVHRVGSRFP